MKVYLVRHGEAKSKEEDPERHLTEKGIEEIRRVARFLAAAGIRIPKIVHSGKTRARQTAEILAEELKPQEIGETDALDPLADPKIWANRLEESSEDIMLVGHLPHLSKLAGLLLLGKDIEIIKLAAGGVICLERNEKRRWTVLWAIRPDIISHRLGGGVR